MIVPLRCEVSRRLPFPGVGYTSGAPAALRARLPLPSRRHAPHHYGALPLRSTSRLFSTTSPALKLPRNLPPRRVIPDSEFTEKFLHGSGPGGQKINKTSSAVQLKHLPTGIVVKCQETRSRTQNRKMARIALAEAVEEHELGENSRTALKARDRSRKKASADKKKRRKYRKLVDGKETGEEVEDGEEGEGGEEDGGVVDFDDKGAGTGKEAGEEERMNRSGSKTI